MVCKKRIIDELLTRYGGIKWIFDPYTVKRISVNEYLTNGLRWDSWGSLTVFFVDGCSLFATRKQLRDLLHDLPFNPIYIDWSDENVND